METSIIRRIKSLKRPENINRDPELSAYSKPFKNALRPLVQNVSNKSRTMVKRLGEGTFGRVNWETINVGNIATKKFTSKAYKDNDDMIHEIAALQYLRGQPYVSQLVGIAPPKAPHVFPQPMLLKATSTVYDRSLYKSWDDIFRTVQQILYGYSVLHSRGIAHRDTKPENMLVLKSEDVMVERNNGSFASLSTMEVMISDFGASKYVTHVPPSDKYTGTSVYASPEILMMNVSDKVVGTNQPTNWFAHDVWAVGMSLYEVITGRLLIDNFNIKSIVKDIFMTFGTPTADDGELFALYTDYKTHVGTRLVDTPKKSIKDRIVSNARFKPADMSILEGIATIVESMLQLSIEKRPTIQTLLENPILGSALPLEPRPVLMPGNYVLPSAITMRMYNIVSNWLYLIVIQMTQHYNLNPAQQMIILDRACIYLYKILDIVAKKNHPILNSTSKLQAIACVALYISSVLYQDYGYEMDLLARSTGGAATTKDLYNILYEVLSFDIQYYGKTIYDEFLDVETDPSLQWNLGYLNMICYQNDFYKKYPIEKVKEIMMEHARMLPADFMKMKDFDKNRDLIPKPFIEAMSSSFPTGGAKRRLRTRRQTPRKKRGDTRRKK